MWCHCRVRVQCQFVESVWLIEHAREETQAGTARSEESPRSKLIACKSVIEVKCLKYQPFDQTAGQTGFKGSRRSKPSRNFSHSSTATFHVKNDGVFDFHIYTTSIRIETSRDVIMAIQCRFFS